MKSAVLDEVDLGMCVLKGGRMRGVVKVQIATNFACAREVVATAERIQIGNIVSKDPKGRIATFWVNMVGGPFFWISGFEILAKRLAACAATILAAFGYLVICEGGMSSKLIMPAMIFGAGLAYFAMPSRVAMKGVKPANVESLALAIEGCKLSDKQLKLLKDGVALYRVQAFERLTRFNYVAGLAWGVLFWYVGTHVLAPDLNADNMKDGLSNAMLGILIFLMVVAGAAAYTAAVRATYLTLDFALLEAEGRSREQGSGWPFRSRASSTDGRSDYAEE